MFCFVLTSEPIGAYTQHITLPSWGSVVVCRDGEEGCVSVLSSEMVNVSVTEFKLHLKLVLDTILKGKQCVMRYLIFPLPSPPLHSLHTEGMQ